MTRYIDPVALDQAAERLGANNDEQLAAALGIRSQTVRNLRARRSSPSLESLVKIAAAAGIPWEQATITASARTSAA